MYTNQEPHSGKDKKGLDSEGPTFRILLYCGSDRAVTTHLYPVLFPLGVVDDYLGKYVVTGTCGIKKDIVVLQGRLCLLS